MRERLAHSLESLALAEELLALWLRQLRAIETPAPAALDSLARATRIMGRLASIRKTLTALESAPALAPPPPGGGSPPPRPAPLRFDKELQDLLDQAHAGLAQLMLQTGDPRADSRQSPSPLGASPSAPPRETPSAPMREPVPASPAPPTPDAPLALPNFGKLPTIRAIRAVPTIPLLNPFRRAAIRNSAFAIHNSKFSPYVRPRPYLRGWRAPGEPFFDRLDGSLLETHAALIRRVDWTNPQPPPPTHAPPPPPSGGGPRVNSPTFRPATARIPQSHPASPHAHAPPELDVSPPPIQTFPPLIASPSPTHSPLFCIYY